MSAHPEVMSSAPPGAGPPPGGAFAEVDGARAALPLGTAVLIVEDEVMIAWMIESVLEDIGFRDIRMASCAREAERLAESTPPGLVISDINLGEGPDGVEVAAALTAARAVPVIFVTAYADEATRQRIATLVPDALILRKPMQPAELRGALQALLGRSPG